MVKRFLFSLGALVLLTGLLSSLPASAHDSSQDIEKPPVSNVATTGSSSNESETENATEDQMHARDLKIEQYKAKAQANAQADLNAKKTEVKQHTQEERQKACEARKANLTKRMSNAVKQAKKHQQKFDDTYAKVKNFVSTKNLTVENYDSLTSAVDTAQSNSAASISALESLDVSIDCSSQNVASTVSNFQQAVKASRDSLKAYRASITDQLIPAIKGASSANSGQEAQ